MNTARGLLAAVVALLALGAAPSAQDLVVSSTTPSHPSTTTVPPSHSAHGADSDEPGSTSPKVKASPEVYSLHVNSRIAHRYAHTVVSSRLANRADEAQEAQFSLVLPETAFISAFLIETEGKVYEAYVKEKEEAKKEYDSAVASGQTAAHVAVSARDANTFNVAVNVAPGQKVTFNLTYEELLARRLGAYSHAVHLAPGRVVADLRVEALIEESRNLSALPAPVFRAADAEQDAAANEADGAAAGTPGVSVERLGGGRARVIFAPTPEQQRQIARALRRQQGDADRAPDSKQRDGLEGQLVIQYDVERDPQGGEVLVDEGHFVHFFAPDELPPLPKHVVFVLDVSGSMEGRKVQQLKEAMTTILGDLKPGDFFNLIEFSYSVTVWNLDSASNNVVYSPYSSYGDDKPPSEPPAPAAYPASAEYVRKATDIVQRMTAGGGTNIYDALRTALAVARGGLRNATLPEGGPRPEPIVVFLTDGEPTVGESRPHKIFQMVSERNERPASALFSLAFGDDADLPFLKKLSLRNAGFARKIYEAADAALQLRNFYRQVASPLLSNVTFEYTPDTVQPKAVTKVRFPTYFMGSELVVAGQRHGAAPVGGAVVARGEAGESRFALPEPFVLLDPLAPLPVPPPSLEPAPGSKKGAPSLERLWAYLTIRQMLDEREANSGLEDKYGDALPKANLTEAQQKARDAADAAKKRALELALQYSFVTPLTSLVVVKPNGTTAADLEGAQPNAPQYAGLAGGAPFLAGGLGGGFAAGGLKHRPLASPAGNLAVRVGQNYAIVDRVAYAEAEEDSFVYSDEESLEGTTPVFLEETTEATEATEATGATEATEATEAATTPSADDDLSASLSTQAFPSFAAAGRPGLPMPAAPAQHYPTTRAPMFRPPGTSVAIAPMAENASSSPSAEAAATEAGTEAAATEAGAAALGTLSDLEWLTNALNGTTGSLLVPLANGTRLLRLGVNKENKPYEECSLPEGASTGGSAHCRHLPHCVLPDIYKDVQSYVRYFCSIDDFAGICCPDAVFPTAILA